MSISVPQGARENNLPYLGKTAARLVSGAKLAPQGRLRKAQGASPGNKHSNKGSPEGAMQLVPVPKRTLNPGLAPWAVLLDPFGVLGFAPETNPIKKRQEAENGQPTSTLKGRMERNGSKKIYW